MSGVSTRHSPGYWRYLAHVLNSLELAGQSATLGDTEKAVILANYRASTPCHLTAFEIRTRREIIAIIPNFYEVGDHGV
jgi:hypothetical protein